MYILLDASERRGRGVVPDPASVAAGAGAAGSAPDDRLGLKAMVPVGEKSAACFSCDVTRIR